MRKLSGQKVRDLREAKKFSRPQLAIAAQTSIDTIKRVEFDQHAPNPNVLAAIADALDVSVDSLFMENGVTP